MDLPLGVSTFLPNEGVQASLRLQTGSPKLLLALVIFSSEKTQGILLVGIKGSPKHTQHLKEEKYGFTLLYMIVFCVNVLQKKL